MQRYVADDAAAFSPAQQKAAAQFRQLIGHPVQGPFAVWIEEPDIFDPAFALLKRFRVTRSIDLRLAKLAILIIARHWSAQFEWHTHAPLAIKAGLDEAVVEAIRVGAEPVFVREDEILVCRLTRQIIGQGAIDDATYAAAETRLGRAGLVELVAVIGYFTMVALTLNAFEVLPRNGERPLDGTSPPRAPSAHR